MIEAPTPFLSNVRATNVRTLLTWTVASLVLSALAVSAAAQDDSAGFEFRGARFLDEQDSLGYDEYRALDPDPQLERREQAKRWVRRSREWDNEARRQPDPAQAEVWTRRASDGAATAVGLCPYLPEGWVLYAQHLNGLGRYADASYCLDQAERTLRYEPSRKRQEELTADFHRLRAVVAYNVGDAQTCHDHVEQALELKEKDEDLVLLSARALIELGRFDEARERLSRFDDRSPSYALSLSVLALLEMRAERLEQADLAFARAYKYGMRGAVFDNDRGRLYLEIGRYDDAVSQFESAISQLPGMMEARSNLAVAHRRAGRLEKAREVLEAMLEERDDYAPAHFNLAETLREQMNAAGEAVDVELGALAFRHYTQAMVHGYDPATVIERRASLAFLSDDLEQAEEDLLRMTEDPDIDGRVLFLLGRVKKEQGRFDVALNLLEMAEQRGYADASLFADRGEILLRQGDLHGAREALRRACDLSPRLVVTRVNLSIVLSQLEELDAAERVLREAEALAPDHPLVQNQREALRRLRGE